MTKEEKSILLKDLCARLQYGVKVDVNFYYATKELSCDLLKDFITDEKSVRPYLRTMSSMTEEEGERLEQIAKETLGDFMFEAEEDGGAIYHMTKWKTLSPAMFDYLNSIHIDYRGLIEMGLALPATEDMYNN